LALAADTATENAQWKFLQRQWRISRQTSI